MFRRRNSVIHNIVSSVVWIAGILVSLAVGFGMIDGVLTVKFIPVIMTAVAGWIVFILTLLGALLKILEVIIE